MTGEIQEGSLNTEAEQPLAPSGSSELTAAVSSTPSAPDAATAEVATSDALDTSNSTPVISKAADPSLSTCNSSANEPEEKQKASNKIFTIPNLISIIRLCMVPIFLMLLIDGHNILATFAFALAAGTDFIDGQIARRTNSVSKLGQFLDPAVDRILMISGVCGLLFVGRLPLWIVILVLARDIFLIIGAAILLFKYKSRVAVVFPGKVATTLLFIGFAGLLLNWPLIPGAGICEFGWLPGLNSAACSWGIWFVYAGLVLALLTTAYYVWAGFQARNAACGK